jgi:Spy/CpxP family protein refolding chaperone
MRRWIFTLAALGAAGPAAAQQHQHAHSPYVGLEHRGIKALSDSQIQQLRDGEGMSLALAAELNHYPGPRHALDLAKELGLTKRQQQQVQALVQAHRPKAQELGAAIIAREDELDQGFARHTITEARLRELTGEIARLQGDLRYLHLAAHLELGRVLTGKQIDKYDDLRGYSRVRAAGSASPKRR